MSCYEDAGLVFTSEAGTLDKLTNPRRRSFVSLLEKARGHRVSFHDLGHTCATLLFSRNVHPKDVHDILGRYNVSITLDAHSHVIPGTKERRKHSTTST
ncbi:MAG: site-specific integrase, partial [Rubrobacter sp.]|nr:site-specific integrase [Rubrobacter sp.]